MVSDAGLCMRSLMDESQDLMHRTLHSLAKATGSLQAPSSRNRKLSSLYGMLLFDAMRKS